MKITHISRHQFHQTRWKSLYLLHGLLFQLASTSPIRNQEPRTSNNELHPSSRDPNAPEDSWRVTDQAQASTLHDLRRIRKTDPSITILERFLVASHDSVDSKSEAKNEEAVYEQSLTLAPGDHLLVRYSHKQPSYLRSQISSPVVDSTFETASLDITLAKNVTFSYSVFVPDQFDFRIPVKLPGIYGGTKSFEGKQSTGDDDTFQAYVMIQEDGIVEFHIQNPRLPHPGISSYTGSERKNDCAQENSATFFVSGSGRLVRGAWTTIRQDVWLDRADDSVGGFNLWIDERFVAGQSNFSTRQILAVEKDNLIQSTQMFPDRKTALFVGQGSGRVPYPPREEDEINARGSVDETHNDRPGRLLSRIIEHGRLPLRGSRHLSTRKSFIPSAGPEEPQTNNDTYPGVEGNGTTVFNNNKSQNMTGMNEAKSSTSNVTDHRNFGAFPALGIPALAELAKENTAKIAAIPKPPSPESRVDEDDDDDDEEEEDEDDEDSSSDDPESPSSSAQVPKLNPFFGALGSILRQQDEPLQAGESA
ncbi:hypothetical protein PCANC_17222 [Puccinia coronata f. sp. avenae]|uniref:Polysaccharide lyase 14 domain-containing protein n=1 Tax=Puccinia coronata f. sp. avenae TaxID=200324 RepID=A0A2N5SG15_9BASI|nr:hypothetical protein PCANC_17222 [Puccinia coronata f. sp. avenae]